ncbi:enolase C-terminal domain-like protein [Candidatus Latescibacterota bacterium]
MKRREVIKNLAIGTAAGISGLFGRDEAVAQTYSKATMGLPPLKITKVRTIFTCPESLGLVVVKVETSEPGLYGLGCATGNLRHKAVKSAVDDYLNPFARGKDADNIEDMWQTAYVSSYWRNGSILNNAMCGLDQALWDIKGKRAGMPVYQLLGGKCRFAVDCYAHGGGRTFEQAAESVHRYMEEGYRHIRIQLGGYGSGYLSREPHFREAGFGIDDDRHMNVGPYVRGTIGMFEHVRKECGDEVELLHDIHERIPPIDAINLVKELEQYRPFFIEDPFAPEDNGYFRILRQQSCCPIAMGELFNSPHEWVPLVQERLIDFIRVHISQIGGITPAMKLARLCEWFNVRTAWHGPGNVSPVGHAANAHIDLAVWNFGIQERVLFSEKLQEIFPGCPTFDNGYMFVNEAPGLGIEINEKLAAKSPLPEDHFSWWKTIRRQDGTAVRP